MAQSFIFMLLFVFGGWLLIQFIFFLIPTSIVAGIGYLLYRGTTEFFSTLKGEVESLDYVAGVSAGVLPACLVFYALEWIPGWSVLIPLGIPLVRIGYHAMVLFSERSADTMKQHAAADDTPPPGGSASTPHDTPPPHDAPPPGGAPPPPRGSGPPPDTTAPPASPLADLYRELGDIIASGDQGLLSQRVSALKRSMDATTFEKNVGAWLRKFNATVQVMETMNHAERTRMDHDFMPLERQKREAELKADIEHHRAREAEAKMRQRMAQEE